MFQKGVTSNPNGRPKGCGNGRIRALAVLDSMLNKEENRDALLLAMQKEFTKDPMIFFKDIVMPLLPKNREINLTGSIEATTITPDQVVRTMDMLTCPGVKHRVRVKVQPRGK